MKVLITDIAWPAPAAERAVFEAAGLEWVLAPNGDEATLSDLARGAGAIATCWAQVTRAVIDAAGPSLRHIARFGVGVDNIDVAHATSRDILVTNLPDYCVDEVADQTMALLLGLNRRLLQLDRVLRAGGWGPQSAGKLYRLRGRTLGVIGLGRIGANVAAKAAAFGMNVIAFHPRLAEREIAARGARSVDLAALFAASDYLSLHCPLNDSTRQIVNAQTLATMKASAAIINTSRGGLVDTDALIAALQSGRLAGAGLDVLDSEPLPAGHPIYALETVIVSPHAGFYSEDSVEELQRRVAEEVARVATGQPPLHPLNRSR